MTAETQPRIDPVLSLKTIYPNVELGENVVIEDYCIIGYPPKGHHPGELKTVIGDGTHIRSHTVIYAGARIGAGCHLSHYVVVREHSTLGDGTSMGINAVVEHHCTIGNNVRLQGQSGVCEYSVIEDEAWIGPRVVFTNVYHPTCDRAKECLAGPIVRKGAIIGAGVLICPDLEIGERSVLGAGAVITKSVEEGAVMFGNPARKIATADKMTCRYDMLNGKTPYPPLEKIIPVDQLALSAAAIAARGQLPPVPLVDLVAQHQAYKQDLRLAMDKVVLNTRFIQGVEVRQFERQFAEFCGVERAVGVASGTDALYLSLKGLGIGPGDEVITSPHTFIATAEAIFAAGAMPVFADIEETTYNLDPEKVVEKITPRTKALLPVHLYGHPAAMEAMQELAQRFELRLIGDAAQAHGATIAGRDVAQWGDAACYSFYPGKNLGAYGDAGGVTTSSADLADHLAMLADHGRNEKYLHRLIGGNHRLDTLQAAVLLEKLKHLAQWNQSRRRIAKLYCELLEGLPIRLPTQAAGAVHVYHQFVIAVADRDRLQQHLKEQGISTGIHYPVPLHLQPALASLKHNHGDFPVTERVVGEILSLPMYPELTDVQVRRVASAICDFFRAGVRHAA
jgi:dTDP-4-amino-4,6-dideoxygalactose transaminase/acetyltransferase-like isoleucine patch superfamily enzyme